MLDEVHHPVVPVVLDPQLHAVIDLESFDVTESELRVDGVVDVVGEAKLDIRYLEESAPLLVVGLGEVQSVNTYTRILMPCTVVALAGVGGVPRKRLR